MNDEPVKLKNPLLSHMIFRYVVTLAVASGLAPLSACSGETGDPIPATASENIETDPTCPGMAPPNDNVCMEAYCNEADLAWDLRPTRAGASCGSYAQCDGRGNCLPLPTRPPPPPVQSPPMSPPSNKPFFIRELGDRCLNVGASSRWASRPMVLTSTCLGTAAERIWIRELDATHDVELRTESGNFCLGVRGDAVVPGSPLEVQPCSGSRSQRFALDGDSILIGLQTEGAVTRDFVIELNQGRTAVGTPLVVGVRDLADAEYFRFVPVDSPGSSPTSGFVKISDGRTLRALLGDTKWGWGTVVEFDGAAPITLVGSNLSVRPGVTLRGYRKGRYQGPELRFGSDEWGSAFLISSRHVRMTGFRLRGDRDVRTGVEASAIQVEAGPDSNVLIDHLDIGFFTGSAIDVRGNEPQTEVCSTDGEERKAYVRAESNFIHDNVMYGVVAGSGAFNVAQGNVMYRNRHDLAADPWARTGYTAFDNLILSTRGTEHHVDMHGSGDPGHWRGGRAGDYFDVAYNTLLSLDDSKAQLVLRGTPCRFMKFRSNVVRNSRADAIRDENEVPGRTVISNNQFDVPDPMTDLGVGDFDGDGTQDVFVGTGTGWFFSSAGQSEWRFLNRAIEHASALRFGDFDGDGRTDVVAQHGTQLDVSWAGESPWQRLNTWGQAIEDIAVGDFNGDGVSDLFAATGTEWILAPSGLGWNYFATSGKRTPALRFGDFDGDRRTDVLGIESGTWKIVRATGNAWEPWRDPLQSSFDGLIVADFDGDRVSDIAGTVDGAWRYSRSALSGWNILRSTSIPLHRIPVGRFDDEPRADAIVYDDEYFELSAASRGTPLPWGMQMMR